MKQVMTIALLWMLASCQKSSSSNNNNNNGLSSQPTAQASFDGQSGGVYKGSLTGSSGYFVVNLQAGKPFIIFQWTSPAGSVDSLFTTSLGSWTSGQAIVKAVFTGSDGSFFWFSVGAGGANPSIDSIHIVGHASPVYASIAKELSTNQIKVYQGSATPTSGLGNGCVNATVNAWINNNTGIYSYLATNGDHGGGTFGVSGSQIQITSSSPAGDTGSFTMSSDATTITGTVSGNGSCVHTINLTRIL